MRPFSVGEKAPILDNTVQWHTEGYVYQLRIIPGLQGTLTPPRTFRLAVSYQY